MKILYGSMSFFEKTVDYNLSLIYNIILDGGGNMKINFKYKPIFDYVFGLLRFATACEDKIYGTEDKSSLSQPVNTLIEGFVESASQFLISETAYFCKLGIADWLMNALVCDDSTIETPEDGMNAFAALTDEELYNYVGGLALASFTFESHSKWKEIMCSIPKMLEYIKKSNAMTELEKIEVIELYKYPNETRQRLSFIFEGFYKIYSTEKAEIEKKSKKALQTYEANYELDEVGFTDKYLVNTNKKTYEKIIVNVSFLQDSGVKWMDSLIRQHDTLWLSIGINGITEEKNINKEVAAEQFLKALGDPTRFKIMTMLASERNYVQSIASELKLAPSTIYHHLETLSGLSLVYTEKKGKKVYYKVHREKIIEGLRILSSIFIGGQYEL
ncbi:MAG: winged helix-turn-helix transcriptional regulator [Clostridiales bacterium]|nr:winged helix-turn-helix transcriptional regulator [Clostridiales bacterium]